MVAPIRIVVAKPGLDGHDRGAKVIARALRDAGNEVIYTGLHQTPEQIVETTIQEDADAVGLSVLSGAHMTLFARVLELLRERGADDVVVFGGGIIPADDFGPLAELGVAKIFTPGATTLIHRLIAPARIPTSALSRPVTVKLLGFAHRFEKGHSLRLVLATTDLTSLNNKVADVITVTTGPGSTLTVNTVATGQPPGLCCGTTGKVPGTGRDLASTGLNVVLPVAALVLIAAGAVYLRRRR